MFTLHNQSALRDLRRLLGGGRLGDLTDAELLGKFAGGRDEAAFAALVTRHGPMVLAACRGVLRHSHDAEDALQATFLVLARKANSLRVDGSLAGWLYRVAFRVALQANDDAARRRARERRAGEEAAMRRTGDVADNDRFPSLFEEISKLPELYRLPIVLCYLEGLPQETAAHRLDMSEGTFRRRLSRAREVLRTRLARAGLPLAGGSSSPCWAARHRGRPCLDAGPRRQFGSRCRPRRPTSARTWPPIGPCGCSRRWPRAAGSGRGRPSWGSSWPAPARSLSRSG